MNNKKYTKTFDNIKKVYDNKSKEIRKERIVNEIKKDNENGCGCKG
jgi:hypothetical protein